MNGWDMTYVVHKVLRVCCQSIYGFDKNDTTFPYYSTSYKPQGKFMVHTSDKPCAGNWKIDDDGGEWLKRTKKTRTPLITFCDGSVIMVLNFLLCFGQFKYSKIIVILIYFNIYYSIICILL